ncbi:MAG: hypothetical protein IKZ00_09475, partial [Bacteroidaceae bacterium]|nr:hypothetical protein [Bacteroidaceae bacterium]
MKKIGIVGHFGGDEVFLDGQTVKTKNLYRAIEERYSFENVIKLDTYGFRKNPFVFFLNAVKLVFNCQNNIMLPDENGIKVFIPLYRCLNVFLKRKIQYVVVGGWLPVVLKKHKIIRWFARQLDGIYVETSSMKEALEEMGFNNIAILPNFKYID